MASELGSPTTLAKMFWDTVDKNADRVAQAWHDGNEWRERTYKEYSQAVRDIGNGLLAAGVKPGDRVGIWSKNRPQWGEVDFADFSIGAATVPIYDTLTGRQAAYILNNSGSKVLFVQDQELLSRVLAVKDEIKSVKTIVLFEGASRAKGVVTYASFVKDGRAYGDKNPKRFDGLRKKVKPDDLASLVYTSGTTGDPKGVMLSHWNFASNVTAASKCVEVSSDDTFLSFLPLSHVFERMGGHIFAYSKGAKVAFARAIETLTEDMPVHRPTLMMSVPRLYEKIHGRITAKVKAGSPVKRAIFGWAMAQGKAANVYRQKNLELPAGLARKVRIADKLVFGKLKEAVGGNLRYFVSGGAALSPDIEEFFWAAGIKIMQGYGLTETSPVTNVNRPGAVRFGSVGKAVPGTQIKIDTSEWESQRTDVKEGEICVKGPQVMQGYFKDKAATDEVMDKGGWFHTGDIGYVDEDGFLFITDRKKEIIVMSNGKNVAPQHIEGLLKLQPHIEQACVIGDDRKYISALIQPDFEALEQFAHANGIAHTGEQLVKDTRVIGLFEKEVELVNAQLSRYEQIKKFWVVHESWSVESGEITPTLKLKRRIIEDKFDKVISSLYPRE